MHHQKTRPATLERLEGTAGLVAIERVPYAELFGTEATVVGEHFGEMLGLDVVLDVVLGLVLEEGTDVAAPHPLLCLCRPAYDILVEMFRAAV